jgi:hypothetical protein
VQGVPVNPEAPFIIVGLIVALTFFVLAVVMSGVLDDDGD